MKDKMFRQELLSDLTDNILPYWLDRMYDGNGGFYGRRDGKDHLHPDAPRGAILNARILWTFSAAYRATGNWNYLDAAESAVRYIFDHFYDKEYGGVFWSVSADGAPLDTKKQFYAIAFTIYGLSEYSRATGDCDALMLAVNLFHDIETHSRDHENGGYIEAAARDWKSIDDMRLSDKDENSSKSMNTHLHILEAYTSLLRVWNDEELRIAHKELIEIFLDRIKDKNNHHLGLFFKDDWSRIDDNYSYGHDIEASWLLLEAATVHGNDELLRTTKNACRDIAIAALEGMCDDGSMIYERLSDGSIDSERHWWVQAECMVGMLYLWKFHGMEEMKDKAVETWNYIKNHLIDKEHGEWFWSILPDGSINRCDDKAGFWKCPYHNSRMHIEAIRII